VHELCGFDGDFGVATKVHSLALKHLDAAMRIQITPIPATAPQPVSIACATTASSTSSGLVRWSGMDRTTVNRLIHSAHTLTDQTAPAPLRMFVTLPPSTPTTAAGAGNGDLLLQELKSDVSTSQQQPMLWPYHTSYHVVIELLNGNNSSSSSSTAAAATSVSKPARFEFQFRTMNDKEAQSASEKGTAPTLPPPTSIPAVISPAVPEVHSTPTLSNSAEPPDAKLSAQLATELRQRYLTTVRSAIPDKAQRQYTRGSLVLLVRSRLTAMAFSVDQVCCCSVR
jgi:hypothetical protein